jgi:hypothetical protein
MTTVIISPGDVDCYPILHAARAMEARVGARVRCLTPTDAQRALEVAVEALALTEACGHNISVWTRAAMPDKYRWKGEYTGWLVCTSIRENEAVFIPSRETMPANDKSFSGLQCRVDDVRGSHLRLLAGQQRLRVTRWCPEIRAAIASL